MKQSLEFSAKLYSQIIEVFEEDSSNYIDLKELKKSEDGLTDFFHALANMIPTVLYNRLTGSDVNHLEFNHIANRLCFQNMNLDKEDKETI